MRDVDHDPDAVHLGDRLFAERRQPVPLPALALAGVRVRQLAVAVVRERNVARAAIVELLDPPEVFADWIPVLDADERDLAPSRIDLARFCSRQRQADLVGRDLLSQPMNGVELL